MHRNLYDPVLRIERTLRRIRAAAYVDRHPVRVEVQHLDGEPEPFADVVRRPFEPCAVGTAWGPPWSTSWFHLTGDGPGAACAGRRVEAARRPRVHRGAPRLPGRGAGLRRRRPGPQGRRAAQRGYVPVPDEHRRRLRRGRGQPDGARRGLRADPAGRRADRAARPALPAARRPSWSSSTTRSRALGHDVDVLLGMRDHDARGRPAPGPGADRAAGRWPTTLDVGDIAAGAADARRRLAVVLGRAGERERPPGLGRRARAHRLGLAVAGPRDHPQVRPHVRQRRRARRGARRTCGSPARRRSSTPGCRSTTPSCSSGSRRRVAAGHFVPVGGMWVESDTNLPGGEAMVRQLVHGTRFFREELGVETRRGVAAGLVRLHRLAAADRPAGRQAAGSCSQKMSWNQTDDFPHHTFWWEGIDGTPGLHALPADRHLQRRGDCRRARPRDVAASARRVRRPGRCCCSGTATAAAGRPARWSSGPTGSPTSRACPGCGSSRRRSSSPRPRRSTPTRRCGPGRCTWSTTAASTPPRSR